MLVVEDQGLLDELMVSLQLVDVVLVVDDVVFVLFQLIHLVFQGSCDLDGAAGNLLVQAKGDTAENEWTSLQDSYMGCTISDHALGVTPASRQQPKHWEMGSLRKHGLLVAHLENGERGRDADGNQKGQSSKILVLTTFLPIRGNPFGENCPVLLFWQSSQAHSPSLRASFTTRFLVFKVNILSLKER